MKVFLDSGAFSASKGGSPIDIDSYMDYIEAHSELIDVYANLDVIGDAEKTWENQQIMEDAGFAPLPVFHLEDEFPKYLMRCFNYPYFCLGGMAGETEPARIRFFTKSWELICDTPDHMPRCKVHGFGLNAPSLVRRFPWYSVDSSSWVYYSRLGIVIMPHILNGTFRYDKPPRSLHISSRKDPAGCKEWEHIKLLSELELKFVESYIHDCGTTVEKLSEDYRQRDRMNLIYFMDMCESMPSYPWAYTEKRASLFR
ncbi:MAG: hypothetical protein DRQ42_00655 [Gammaproteobacteria bacterium]|nr:MAG: hypothetical protein DRQ42_00655 [Gammaproteobacteria bacterium]